LRARRDSNP